MVEEDKSKSDANADDVGSKVVEGTPPASPSSPASGESVAPERGLIDEIKEEKVQLAKIRDSIKKENDRTEKLQINAELQGKGHTGIAPTQKKTLTDVEYAEAMERGEVDPFKDDGVR